MFAWQKVNRIRSQIITHFQTKTMIQSTEPHRPWAPPFWVLWMGKSC